MNIELSIINNKSKDSKDMSSNSKLNSTSNTNSNIILDSNDVEEDSKNPLFDSSSNDDSYVNIDMDIDNDTFVKNANKGIDETFQKKSFSKIKITNDIPKQTKFEQLNHELDEVSNKSTIYEYHFEKLNKIYDAIGFMNLILDLSIILVGSVSLIETFEFEPEIIVIVLGFINGIFTGISKLFKYKDKIAYIGKYMSDLEHLKDDIKVMLIKLEYENISDQSYLKHIEKINLVLTNGNSAIFNIDSKEYYDYYNRMKQIKEKKRKINHEICLEKERKYNEFSKRHLEYLYERLDMKKKLKDIHEQVKANNINDFYESDVFTITNLTTSEE